MTIRLVALLAAAAVAWAAPARAELGALDARPAATLLLPYFEVNLADPAGNTTLLSINNAAAAPTLAHVTLWTDYSVPTLNFDVYLTGYDVVTINLRDIFAGNLPVTGPTVSNQGPLSDPQVNFPNCGGVFPFVNPALTPDIIDRIVAAHTGQPIATLGGVCAGANLGDNVARGYVTVDSVSECSLQSPPDGGYFLDGGTGIANNQNRLWGDYFFIDPVNNFAHGDPLVHIEANDGLNALNVPLTDPNSGTTVANVANATGYTFYGRYFTPATGADNREPLGTLWAARYLNGGAFTGGTTLIVWRDSTADDIVPTTDWCSNGPSWLPLGQQEVIAFDEQENALEICATDRCFPRETGRYSFGDEDLAVPFTFGWVQLNLNNVPDSATGDHDFGTSGNIAQSHVTVVDSALGRFSVGLPAIKLRGALVDQD